MKRDQVQELTQLFRFKLEQALATRGTSESSTLHLDPVHHLGEPRSVHVTARVFYGRTGPDPTLLTDRFRHQLSSALSHRNGRDWTATEPERAGDAYLSLFVVHGEGQAMGDNR